jgi:transposase
MAAVTQLRNPGPGRNYYLGKKPKAAVRCLKRRVSDAVYRRLDATRRPAKSGARAGTWGRLQAPA